MRKSFPPQYRHIVHSANGQLPGPFPQAISIFIRLVIPACEALGFPTIAAMQQEKYGTIATYLERELRYMEARE
jgi:hypothetical protein